MSICRLCGEPEQLLKSHIIPKGFLTRTKGASSQLIKVKSSGKKNNDNANWTERLFCSECEGFLNKNYEESQLRFLRDGNKMLSSENKITFLNYNFDKFYLFWLSIFWRASISTLPEFSSMRVPHEIGELFRSMLLRGTTVTEGGDRSDIFKIGVSRVYEDLLLGKEMSKGILSPFVLKKTDESFTYYFMVEGLLVVLMICKNESAEMEPHMGELKRSAFLKMPIVTPYESPYAAEIYKYCVEKIVKFKT